MTNGLSLVPKDEDSQSETWALNVSLGYGASISRLFLPLLSGTPLVILSEDQARDTTELVRAVEGAGITNIFLVTPQLREILRNRAGLFSHIQGLRTLVVGGAAVTPEIAAACADCLPHTTLINAYAVSEAGGAVTVAVKRAGSAPVETDEAVLAGRPFPNTHVYLLDDSGTPVSDGAVGEIYIGASHLACGYWNQPFATAQRFLPDPFSKRPGQRMYRTGDLGRRQEDGRISIIGRSDEQVKIRGYRVELGEIESALLRYPGVREAAVTVHGEVEDVRLAAYILPQVMEEAPSPAELRRYLVGKLPEFMLPSVFIIFKSGDFPRTLTGKLDRKRLPAPDFNRGNLALDDKYEEPRNVLESQILKIWADVFQLDQLGINDTFMEIGGNSLLATRILSLVRDRLGAEVTFKELLDHPTVSDLARFIRTYPPSGDMATEGPDDASTVPVGNVFLLSRFQESFLRRTVHAYVTEGPDRQDWTTDKVTLCLSIEGALDLTWLTRAINGVIERHAVLRTAFLPVVDLDGIEAKGWSALRDIGPSQLGSIRQKIRFEQAFPTTILSVENIDLRRTERGLHTSKVQSIMWDAESKPFSFDCPPLVRSIAVRVSDEEHILIVTVSHLVCDGWSLNIFLEEMCELYSALAERRPPTLSKLSIQYSDYIFRQQAKRSEDPPKSRTPRQGYSGDAPRASAVGRRFATVNQGFRHGAGLAKGPQLLGAMGPGHGRAAHEIRNLSVTAVKGLRAFADQAGFTPFVTVCSAYQIALHKFLKVPRMTVGTMMADRGNPESQKLIACLSRPRKLYSEISDDTRFIDILDASRRCITDGFEGPFRDAASSSVPQFPGWQEWEGEIPGHKFSIESVYHLPLKAPTGLVLKRVPISPIQKILTSLRLFVNESNSGELRLDACYCLKCYDAVAMNRLLDSLVYLVDAIIADPFRTVPITTYPIES
jgi:acyl carrier protein